MKPQEVALLRRQQILWLEERGQNFFEHTISLGTQSLYPRINAGPSTKTAKGISLEENNNSVSAGMLMREEIRRLSEADMWYVDRDTCGLVSAAYGNMPAFQPQRHDLPSRYGFVMFDRPIMSKELEIDKKEFYRGAIRIMLEDMGVDLTVYTEEHLDALTKHIVDNTDKALSALRVDAETREYIKNYISRAKKINALEGGVLKIGAMSWGDQTLGDHGDGTWITFYAQTAVTDKTGNHIVENITPLELIIEGEIFINWESVEQKYVGGGKESYDWFKMLLATFRLASQRNLCTETSERVGRSERRRCQRGGMRCSDIRVVRLRHSQHGSAGTAGSGKEYSCRWKVSGHWRNQWYPTVEDHRPIWIMDHIKGPDDKPFRGGDRVKIV